MIPIMQDPGNYTPKAYGINLIASGCAEVWRPFCMFLTLEVVKKRKETMFHNSSHRFLFCHGLFLSASGEIFP